MKASTAAAIIASLGIIGVSGYFLYKYYTSTPRTVITMPTATTIVSPTPTVTPIPTTYPISVTITNLSDGVAVTLTNSNPTAVLPPGTQFDIEIANGEPFSTYFINISGTDTSGEPITLSEQVTTDNMGYADITINLPSIPVQYEIQVMGPLINTYFEAYYGLVTSSPITTSSPISSPISPQPISVAVINMQTGESVVLTNSNPTAVLPPSTQFYVQITNGQPNSTYNISASATCPDGSADNTSLQLTTNSSGTVGGSIGFTCSPVGYQIKITGPLINNYFEAYYTYVPPRSGPVPK